MATWVERTSFPAELGRTFLNETDPEISVATFHADGHVSVYMGNQEAANLVERLLAAGYVDVSQGVENVRGLKWQSDKPAPDAGALVFAQS